MMVYYKKNKNNLKWKEWLFNCINFEVDLLILYVLKKLQNITLIIKKNNEIWFYDTTSKQNKLSIK